MCSVNIWWNEWTFTGYSVPFSFLVLSKSSVFVCPFRYLTWICLSHSLDVNLNVGRYTQSLTEFLVPSEIGCLKGNLNMCVWIVHTEVWALDCYSVLNNISGATIQFIWNSFLYCPWDDRTRWHLKSFWALAFVVSVKLGNWVFPEYHLWDFFWFSSDQQSFKLINHWLSLRITHRISFVPEI